MGSKLFALVLTRANRFTGPKMTLDSDELSKDQQDAIIAEGLTIDGVKPPSSNSGRDEESAPAMVGKSAD